MCFQLFLFRHRHKHRSQITKPFFTNFLKTDFFHKVSTLIRYTLWQKRWLAKYDCSGSIIPGTFGEYFPKRQSRHSEWQLYSPDSFRIQDKMFRSIFIYKLYTYLQIFEHHKSGILPSRPGNFTARQQVYLPFHLFLNFFQHIRTPAYKHDLAVFTVFCLRQQIGSNIFRTAVRSATIRTSEGPAGISIASP